MKCLTHMISFDPCSSHLGKWFLNPHFIIEELRLREGGLTKVPFHEGAELSGNSWASSSSSYWMARWDYEWILLLVNELHWAHAGQAPLHTIIRTITQRVERALDSTLDPWTLGLAILWL